MSAAMHRIIRVTPLVIPLLLSACAAPSPTQLTTPSPTADALNPRQAVPTRPAAKPAVTLSVIFDDDGSPDGTTALFYLLSHPRVSVEGIGISYGEAHPDVYIQHIGRQLDHLGLAGIPLGAGQDGPLAGTNEFPEALRDHAGQFWGLPIPNPGKVYPAQGAAEMIASIVNQSPGPVTIFVSGPSTNLAQALRFDPDIRDNIAAVYIMGGAVDAPGNIHDLLPDSDNIVAEWNIYGDPVAADEVFDSGMDLYLVPLDATNQVTVNKEDTRQWRLGGGTADFAADIYDSLLNNWGVPNAAIWDLMTAAIMVDPGLCAFQTLHLQVVTDEGPTSGQTVVAPDEAPNVQVCLQPDADRIRQTLIEVFSSAG